MVYIKHLHIYTSRFVENLAYNLQNVLKRSMECSVYVRQLTPDDVKKLKKNEYFMLISPQSTLAQSSLTVLRPNTYFIYQTEQLNTKERAAKFHNNEAMFKLFNNAYQVFDYSRDNMLLYSEKYNKVPMFLPFISGIDTNTTATDTDTANTISSNKTIDVLFYGTLNQRRYIIIEALKQLMPNLNIVVEEVLFGKQLQEKIKQSKIVLNIHNYEHATLETARIMEAMQYGVHIISEKTHETELMASYEDVHFIDELIDYTEKVSNSIDIDKKYFVNLLSIINRLLNTKMGEVKYNNNKNIALIKHLFFKTTFIDECMSNIPYLKNLYKLYNPQHIISNYSTLLIEFRIMPHCECLLLNTMLRFTNWKHTIVCGNENKQFFNEIIQKYNNPNINLIVIDDVINNTNDYNTLLLNKEFWKKLPYEYILLYQEDSFIFHNNIDTFLKYDYVGAPWPIEYNINKQSVGNGGFSLRKVQSMIQCIEQVPEKIYKTEINEFVKTYMKQHNLINIPEDVYFSSVLHNYNIGQVAPYDIARNFSLESTPIPKKTPLGIHQCWNFHHKYRPLIYKYILSSNYYIEATTHRFGWNKIITHGITNNYFIKQSSDTEDNIHLIDSLEAYFIWNNNSKINSNWVGVIHYTNPVENIYKNQHVDNILTNKNFIKSLDNCKAIICLSSSLKIYVENFLKKMNINHVKIIMILHPITNDFKVNSQYNIENIIENGNIIQLGQQYRIVSTIYRINTDRKKIWLPGCSTNKAIDILRAENKYYNHVLNNINDVDILKVNDDNYDEMLLNNILIIPLHCASANNSILEIIIMNAPAFISRNASTEEYIGKDYPLFFNKIEEVNLILEDKILLRKKLIEAYEYLISMDKSEFSIENFYKNLQNIVLNI